MYPLFETLIFFEILREIFLSFIFYILLIYFVKTHRGFYILYVKIQNKLPTLQLIARMGTSEAWIMGFKSYVAHPKKPWMSPIL